MMRKWTRWALVMLLATGLWIALAGCGGDSDESSGDEGGDAPANLVPQAQPTPEGTEVFEEPISIANYEPGTQVQTGLTLVSSTGGKSDGTAYFYAVLRNDSGGMLAKVNVLMYSLDEMNYSVAESQATSLLTDIPPGQEFFVGGSYPVPERAVDSAEFVLFDTGEPSYQGVFDLPVTVTYAGAGETGPYLVRGTVENTSGQALLFPVVSVLLVGPDEQSVGLSYAVMTSLAPGSAWEPGVSAEFEAGFDFTALDPQMVREARVLAVGYTLIE